MQTISVKGLPEKRSHGKIDLIDVRMPAEYREHHVGAGLMFAGLTGVRSLASQIEGMPWNKCEGGRSCSA